ncbi:hypothetical protein [Streptococcus merionis]|uniref:hypothetical protein n=1 Tax=Streptococcus merionis TaxID=400065 RepID=UPI0026ECA523|nr:hypothetical protein [Streptococcus merionis]
MARKYGQSKDDWVTVYGTCKGRISYTSIFGQSMTMPYMLAGSYTYHGKTEDI